MIKLFRHIRRTLINKNNMGKYFKYAIGEILLVVIGILIALQINNWNEKRKLKAEEKEVVQQLSLDFSQNKKALDYFLSRYDASLKVTNLTLRNTGPKVLIPSDKIFDSILRINTPKVQLMYTSKMTKSAINLELLSNKDLRQLIVTYQLGFDSYKTVEENLHELTYRQRKIHQKYMSLVAEIKNEELSAFSNDTLGFLRDREFQNITVDKRWNADEALYYLKRIEKQNDSILSTLKKELENF